MSWIYKAFKTSAVLTPNPPNVRFSTVDRSLNVGSVALVWG